MSTEAESKGTNTGQAEPEPSAIRLIATLSLAGLFSGLILVGAYEVTLPRILANQARELREKRLGEYGAAETHLRRGLQLGMTHRQWTAASAAVVQLMHVVGSRQQRTQDGLRYHELAEGLVTEDGAHAVNVEPWDGQDRAPAPPAGHPQAPTDPLLPRSAELYS